ncbi:MAG: hypothetical protein KAH38_12130 [Candidatus Hydrogenedentes bacterium]|nr:hypothetical protein [Candidatus Hydrogenedentota bacterium]
MLNNKINRLYTPLGNVGSGCIGIDHSGHFYNDILHLLGQGPVMPDTFPVLRASFGRGEPYIRTLCSPWAGEKKAVNESVPQYLEKTEYKQQISYPLLSSHLCDDKAPLQVVWTCFSPLAPYDHVASVIPCMLMGVRVTNPTKHPVLCSLMFCMNNLATEIAGDGTENPAQVHFVRIEPTVNDNRTHQGSNLFRGSITDAQPDVLKSYVRNAVLFGDRRDIGDTARPHFCLGVKEQTNAIISRGIWDPESETSSDYFWKVFKERGIAAPPPPGTISRAGAVSCATRVAPGASYRFDFLFSWHVPPKFCEAMGTTNGYIQHFPNAPESIRYGLCHLDYLYKAVTNWQQQLSSSGVPKKFSNALIDSTRAFTTYIRHQKKNGLTLLAQPSGDKESSEEWDFLNAFALLAFAPRFHAAAVTTKLRKIQEQSEDTTTIQNGTCLQQCAEVILSAYADVLYTGNRARFRDWYPRTVSILSIGLQHLLQELASPEKSNTPQFTATLGLWVAAINAVVLMAREQNDEERVQKREAVQQALTIEYNTRLKVLAEKNESAITEKVNALAGACYAELLNLNPLASVQCVESMLPESSTVSREAGVNDKHSLRTRILVALSKALFTRKSIVQQKDALKPFLTDLMKYKIDTITGQTVLPNRLALWTVLQALSGVYYSSLHHSLIIRPSSLAGLGVTIPVFTPVSLGKVNIQVEKGPKLIVVLRISLEIPLSITSITLQLPVIMHHIRISCLHDGEAVTTNQELLPGNGNTHMVLRFKSPMKITSTLTVRLREAPTE